MLSVGVGISSVPVRGVFASVEALEPPDYVDSTISTYASTTADFPGQSRTFTLPTYAEGDTILIFGFLFGRTVANLVADAGSFDPIEFDNGAVLLDMRDITDAGGWGVMFLASKTASASESDIELHHYSGATNCQVIVATYRGGDTITFLESVKADLSGTGNVWNHPGIANAAASKGIFFGTNWGDTSNNLTPVDDYEEREDAVLLYLMDKDFPSAGTIPAIAQPCNSNVNNPNGSYLVALAA